MVTDNDSPPLRAPPEIEAASVLWKSFVVWNYYDGHRLSLESLLNKTTFFRLIGFGCSGRKESWPLLVVSEGFLKKTINLLEIWILVLLGKQYFKTTESEDSFSSRVVSSESVCLLLFTVQRPALLIAAIVTLGPVVSSSKIIATCAQQDPKLPVPESSDINIARIAKLP